jgi:hypothetical protein
MRRHAPISRSFFAGESGIGERRALIAKAALNRQYSGNNAGENVNEVVAPPSGVAAIVAIFQGKISGRLCVVTR